MKRSFLLLAALTATSALAHHGWSDYDANRPLTLTGTIESSTYTQPHGQIHLKTADGSWDVVLAPPSRMESRGLGKAMLAAGQRATVYGYPHRTNAGELRAERITIGDKTTELR
ncbi:hypothetical protein SAMN02800694_2998 [Luteibacter sp. UNCMF331Sha3.1]|uniref:DUF6152 family protein n=1 Tax=Luteibacter sp. UNCMF331Sha3.1 TaxID=1502760 RepID=UPI0008BCAB30|nr:DUF6152 family protein [Luteibacter sp. UNCMF331Sha3.1]SEN17546.1 hypothetical protein SAMN02800694_2998 [Luteibacter sp. UNCMF331Sha3.1]